MDTNLAKVVRASAFLVVGSVMMTGGMLCAVICLAIPNGFIGGLGFLVSMVPMGLYWFNRGLGDMQFLH